MHNRRKHRKLQVKIDAKKGENITAFYSDANLERTPVQDKQRQLGKMLQSQNARRRASLAQQKTPAKSGKKYSNYTLDMNTPNKTGGKRQKHFQVHPIKTIHTPLYQQTPTYQSKKSLLLTLYTEENNKARKQKIAQNPFKGRNNFFTFKEEQKKESVPKEYQHINHQIQKTQSALMKQKKTMNGNKSNIIFPKLNRSNSLVGKFKKERSKSGKKKIPKSMSSRKLISKQQAKSLRTRHALVKQAQTSRNQYMSDTEMFSKKEKEPHKYRHLVFSPEIEGNLFKRHLILTIKGLIYSTQCLKPPSMKFVRTKMVELPREDVNSKSPPFLSKLTYYKVIKKTLVLDLDETLIHSQTFRTPNSISILVSNPLAQIPQMYFVMVRPHCREFLKAMAKIYEIVVFTASSKDYAEAVVKKIDPHNKYIDFVLVREDCMVTRNGFYLKDLRILKGRKMEDVMIVDNLTHSFGFQVDNGIPIIEYTGRASDRELYYLQDILTEANKYPDVRDYLKTKFRLRELAKERPNQLISSITDTDII